jgi:hypothetical protein
MITPRINIRVKKKFDATVLAVFTCVVGVIIYSIPPMPTIVSYHDDTMLMTIEKIRIRPI